MTEILLGALKRRTKKEENERSEIGDGGEVDFHFRRLQGAYQARIGCIPDRPNIDT